MKGDSVQRDCVTIRRLAGFFGLCLLITTSTAAAEQAWVKDEVRVNVRSGASNRYRVIGAIGTGDKVEILSRLEGWTEIRTGSIESGWMPAGFLHGAPPARVTLEARDRKIAELEQRVEEITASESRIRLEHDELASRDGEQQAEISRLTRDNLELRVGARWPEWLTGAGIVLVGMILGSIVARGSSRRRQPRIKL
jgi:SH3 domain protein